jgi:fructose-1,6-bisphosphatase/inositol monophosphatase family enzyme
MIHEVEVLVRAVAETIVLPRYRRLKRDDIEEKSPGEIVTIVDREAETALSKGLSKLISDCTIIGEEAAFTQPEIVEQYYKGSGKGFWLIDPLDGTANFVEGKDEFAIMVALVYGGETVCSWCFEPARNRMCVAELGGGAYLNGERIQAPSEAYSERLTGSILDRFFPDDTRSIVDLNRPRVVEVPGSKCAGKDYAELAQGLLDFNMYWRLLPWDHAPGVLLLNEAGGFSGYLDGMPYCPMKRREGLISARNKDVWYHAIERLLANGRGYKPN